MKRRLSFYQNQAEKSDAFDVSFIFHMPIPKSFSKKKKKFYQDNPCRHLKKPDTDNLQKLYLDCMSGILFPDDSKVNIKSAIKIYASNEPKTIIKIFPKNDTLSWEDINHYGLS